MRAAAFAAAVVAAFVGVMYLRFASDSVPEPPSGAAVGGPQCAVFRDVSDGDASDTQATCGPSFESPAAPVSTVSAGTIAEPTRPAPPDSIGGVKVVPLEMGAPTEMPPDVALIVQTCMGECGNVPSIARVYRDPAGEIRTDPLVMLQSLGLSPKSSADPTGAYFTGFAADPDGTALALSVCVHGACAFAGNGTEFGAEGAIFRSFDGGITWFELLRKAGVASVIGMTAEKEALVAEVAGYDGQGSRIAYKTVPGDQELLPPSDGAYRQPILAPDGNVFWRKDDGISFVRTDGTQWLGIWADPRQAQFALARDFAFDATGNQIVVSGMAVSQAGQGVDLVLLVGRDGSLQQAFSTPTYVIGAVWLDESHIVATLGPATVQAPGPRAGFVPAVIDLSTRTVHPVRFPFLDSPFLYGINTIIAVQRGSFARVVNTDNTCLNIRAEPLPSAGILDCAAEGVLLRDTGTIGGPAGEWLKVVTPAGAEGWANAQYLER